MKFLCIAILSLGMASACGKKDGASGGGGGGDLMTQAAEHAHAACACQDRECAKQHVAWFHRTEIQDKDKVAALPADQQEAFKTMSAAASDCRDKFPPAP